LDVRLLSHTRKEQVVFKIRGKKNCRQKPTIKTYRISSNSNAQIFCERVNGSGARQKTFFFLSITICAGNFFFRSGDRPVDKDNIFDLWLLHCSREAKNIFCF